MSHKHHKYHESEDSPNQPDGQPHSSGTGHAADGEATAAAGAEGKAVAPGDVESLGSKVAEQEEMIAKLQRALADMDNRRKRAERLMDENARYALQGVAVDILPVIDNFSRALKHADETNDFVALHDGLKMVHDQFLAVLKKHHVKRIEALGRPFDPNHHEAVAEVESAAHPDHTVIEVDQEGYQLHDRTIRPSRVIVSRRPSAPEAKPPTGDEPKKTE